MNSEDRNTSFPRKRYQIIDFLRGIAVILMIIFHLFYDLTYLEFTPVEFFVNNFWYSLPRIIVFIFLFCVGASLVMAYKDKIHWKKYNSRLLKLILCSILVSLGTYFMFPTRWVYFGTLHAISFLSIIGLVFLRYPKISLILGLVMFILEFLGLEGAWITLSHKSMDYISPFPWLGAVLFGITSAHYGLHKYPVPILIPQKIITITSYLGKKSLVIYLLHQPILFGSLYGLSLLIK